ncbi:MAG: aminotransferase class V-fold PLP-dependent enzyme [Oscillospiraceae bacterium]
MIYFDCSATSLEKPPEVAEATAWAIGHLGNAGRSFYGAAMQASREIFAVRRQVAGLVGLASPLQVAFTSSATESLNLVVQALVRPEDHVITTVLEHNSVLRPLYGSGCRLSFLNCDDEGNLLLESLASLVQPSTKYVFATHGSNVLGTLTNARQLAALCRAHGLTLVLDISQTLGHTAVTADRADVFCFTGHKGLMGPQGTGGIAARQGLKFTVTKTGGAGYNSFAKNQGTAMPEVFEAGTANAHGLFGLQKGAAFVSAIGVPAIEQKEQALARCFWNRLQGTAGIKLYGPPPEGRLGVVAVTVGGQNSEETALRLWEGRQIATRPGSHCAPLLHTRFGTEKSGMVRFSFGYFNTFAEVDTAADALCHIAAGH